MNKPLSLRKTLKRALPFIALLTAILLLSNILMYQYYNVVCQALGYGEAVITIDEDAQDLDANYIDFNAKNISEAKANAGQLTKDVAAEGVVLLENDSKKGSTDKLLPLKASTSQKANVTLFGYKAWRVTESGGSTSSLYAAMQEHAKINVNPATNSTYSGLSSDVANPAEVLAAHESTYSGFNDAAVVVFGRSSGEGDDVSMDMGESAGHRSALSLEDSELALLEYLCGKFDNVIVLINSDNTMELDFLQHRNDEGGYKNPYNGKTYNFSNVRAALWIGGCGERGLESVCDILVGDVNPSGHLVDTYISNLKSSPAAQNFNQDNGGNTEIYTYTNVPGGSGYSQSNNRFVQYEEGIYIGYRYYETAYAENKAGNYAGFDYDKEVVYPFGYGLSYTTFKMEYVGTPSYSSDNVFTFTVKVTNTGTVAGKAVAQIYVHAPYESNKEMNIEVAEVVLGGFKKTDVIEPGKFATVQVEVDMDYVTSYDYKVNKCYVQLGGDYVFYLSENAHSWATASADCTYVKNLEQVIYDGSTEEGHASKRVSDQTTAVNVLDDVTNYMFTDTDTQGYATNFSRKDFKGTFPTAPTAEHGDFTASAKVLEQLKDYVSSSAWNDDDEMPETGNEVVLTFADMRGKDYDDPAWEIFMKQFSTKSLEKIYADGSFGERADYDGIGVPESVDLDGPYGWFGHAVTLDVMNYYNSEVMIASTWDTQWAAKLGECIAEEGYYQSTSLTGWYGGGLNTHRSPFCGRNQEYFSEDGLIAGKMAAAELGAASEKGLVTYVKHFVLNEGEDIRNGGLTWANEQAVREIYAKPFEIYIKEAKRQVKYYEKVNGEWVMKTKTMSGATGMMTSYNRIGAIWTGGCEGLNTILRDEWNFLGNICTDGGGGPNSYMNSNRGLYTGMTTMMLTATTIDDATCKNATTVIALQDAVKHNIYNRANSNALQSIAPGSQISYTKAAWENWLLAATIVLSIIDAALVGLVAYVVVTNIKYKKSKEK